VVHLDLKSDGLTNFVNFQFKILYAVQAALAQEVA